MERTIPGVGWGGGGGGGLQGMAYLPLEAKTYREETGGWGEIDPAQGSSRDAA